MAKYNDLTVGQMEAAVNKLGGMEGLRRFLAGELEVVGKQVAVSGDLFTPASFQIVVNYDKPIEELVARGQYNYANPDITSAHFPTTRSGHGSATLTGELVHFGVYVSTKEALKRLAKMGKRPGETHELLEFGIKFPQVQKEYPVIALGSAWQGPGRDEVCPCLGRWDGDERSLHLDVVSFDWYDGCRFLALDK